MTSPTKLYLIPFLHQTTTGNAGTASSACCILFHFYIKPQRLLLVWLRQSVVSYSISTSNHNVCGLLLRISWLYLIPFLHQTTTPLGVFAFGVSCILFHFYIKPQPQPTKSKPRLVVSYSISTSNHNRVFKDFTKASVVSYSISTSNHNLWRIRHYFQAHYHLNHILIFNGML